MDWAAKNEMRRTGPLPAHAIAAGGDQAAATRPGVLTSLLGALLRLLSCNNAAIGPIAALMLVPISGALAYSIELGSWNYMQRSMQNAADSAALAAATNNNASLMGSDPYYRVEARAAAKRFGFTDGNSNTTVTADRVSCPAGTVSGVTCYSATISTKFPLLFSKVVGFNGDTTYGSGRGQSILAMAVATTAGGSTGTLTSPCIWTFVDLRTTGSPDADLTGCSVLSNGTMTCTGNGLKADYAIAATKPSGRCAANDANDLPVGGSVTIPPDPYASLASNIPTAGCSTSPPTKNNVSQTLLVYCGGLSLTGNYTITSPNTVIVVKDGPLNMNGNTLSTAAGASATIILAGSNAGITGKSNDQGILNIQAPDKNSGSVWKGVAIYQDPNAAMVDTTLAGAKNNQAWTITGLVYLPKSNVTIKGAVNHFAGAPTCMVLVANSATVNGTGSILQAPTGCDVAGTTVVNATVTSGTLTRQKLVL